MYVLSDFQVRRERNKYVVLRLVDLRTNESRQIGYSHGGKGAYGREIIWMSEDTVAVLLRDNSNEFFFTKIEEVK